MLREHAEGTIESTNSLLKEALQTIVYLEDDLSICLKEIDTLKEENHLPPPNTTSSTQQQPTLFPPGLPIPIPSSIPNHSSSPGSPSPSPSPTNSSAALQAMKKSYTLLETQLKELRLKAVSKINHLKLELESSKRVNEEQKKELEGLKDCKIRLLILGKKFQEVSEKLKEKEEQEKTNRFDNGVNDYDDGVDVEEKERKEKERLQEGERLNKVLKIRLSEMEDRMLAMELAYQEEVSEVCSLQPSLSTLTLCPPQLI